MLSNHSRVNIRTRNMSIKALLVLYAQALLANSALSQCITSGLSTPYGLYDGLAPSFAYDGLAGCAGRGMAYEGLATPLAYDGSAGWAGRGLAYEGFPALATALDFTPTSGGALPVTSASASLPTGISVISENVYEGTLAVAGELPFVGSVGMEGVLPSAGAGAINHACGNGINAMVSETNAFSPVYADALVAPAAAIAPFGAIAPGIAAPAFDGAITPGFGVTCGGWTGRGWGNVL